MHILRSHGTAGSMNQGVRKEEMGNKNSFRSTVTWVFQQSAGDAFRFTAMPYSNSINNDNKRETPKDILYLSLWL